MSTHEATYAVAVLDHVGIDTARQCAFDFFLYFPTEGAASAVGRELNETGFICQVRESARGEWLCLATARVVPDDSALETVFHLMETMAEDFGGSFDGWETQVRAH
jgi:regulator of ribonuclease activity B